jgi:hypothetical protein
MMQIATSSQKSIWYHHIGKGVALLASTGAALVSIISALYSYGMLGNSESHQSIGNLGAAWVRLRPAIDTATAIGDTIHFAATIADKNGSILVGARPTWTTGDSTIATVGADGAVIARGPGLTTVSAVVGTLVANSKVFVKQKSAGVLVSSPAGDTAVVLVEGGQLQLRARPLDARGHGIAQSGAITWHVDDSTVAGLDAKGLVTGRNAGRTVVSAGIDGASGYLPVAVITTATALAPVAGMTQRVEAGHALPQKIVVRATTRKGGPAAGKNVTFRLSDGQGLVEPATAITDADGRARTTWTLGNYPGRQTLLASVENVDSALAIVAEADPVASNTRVTPLVADLRARAGELLTDSIGVRVTDTTGRVLPDVPVRWTALDGTVEAVTPRTDSLGIAHARWSLTKKTGTQRLRAHVGAQTTGRGIDPVTVSVTALAGSVVGVELLSGDKQRSPAGSPLPKPIVLRVVDANGNGAADVAVVLALSGGSVSDTSLRTDSLGMVNTRWTMGRSAGDHTLAVHVDGVKKLIKVTARATPGAAANLSFDDAPSNEKGALPKIRRLFAIVTDVYGNPVPDASVMLSVKTGIVTPARAVTDARGRIAVRWALGTKTGEQTLRGTVRTTDVKGAYVTQLATAHDPKTDRRRRQ